MATWSVNNRASTTVWATLFLMDELDRNFSNSEKLKINELLFFNVLDSAAIRLQKATVLADQLDVVFRFGRGAVFEKNITRPDAVAALTEILADGDKIISDLAEVADKNYLFFNENSVLN